MYNLTQLNTFVKVAELGSFNKVAEEDFISPNAVMMQINNLENELGGTKLFNRSKKGNTLTEAGKLLYNEAKDILRACEESKKRVIEAGTNENNTVRITVPYGSTIPMMDEIWKEVHRRWPELRLELTPVVYDSKVDRDLWSNFGDYTDLFFTFVDMPDDDSLEGVAQYKDMMLGGLLLGSMPLFCVVDNNNRLADKDEITFEDLNGENVVILSEGWGKNAALLKEIIEKEVKDVELQVLPYFGVETYNECANDGLIILGAIDFAYVHPFITAKPMTKYKELYSAYGLTYLYPPSEPVKKLINIIKEIISEDKDVICFADKL